MGLSLLVVVVWFSRQLRLRGRSGSNHIDDAASALGVEAPLSAPKFLWSFAWRSQKSLLPVLHFWDKAAPGNSCVNLQILWLRALAGDERSYSLLPRQTRFIVSPPLRRLYPRLHHQNVLLRTTFLDEAIEDQLSRTDLDILMIDVGAGFSARGLRLSSGYARVREVVEIDLPSVVDQKKRLLKDRNIHAPRLRFVGADLSPRGKKPSDSAAEAGGATVDAALESAVSGRYEGRGLIFVVEALLIYLDPDDALALLAALASVASSAPFAALCFADRVPGVQGVAETDVQEVLKSAGWTHLERYLPKPGLARHMGIAKLTTTRE